MPSTTADAEAARPAEPQVWLRRYAKALCGATLVLILMGGLVTSHDAGLSVPDWPTTFDHNMFTYPPSQWVGAEYRGYGGSGVFWEHSHRLVASVVGLMTLVFSVWLALADKRIWVVLLGFAGLMLVIVQGVLGGLTVLFGLPTAVSVSHGVIAQGFFVITIVLAYALSREWRRRKETETDTARRTFGGWSAAVLALVFAQLIAGAVMRHSGAGLAVPDFPLMGGHVVPRFDEATMARINEWRAEIAAETGRFLPPVDVGAVHLHLMHRFLAVIAVAAVAIFSVKALRAWRANPLLMRTVLILDALVLAQFALGMWTVWSGRGPIITSLHVAGGAALLGWATLTALRARPAYAPAEDRADVRQGQLKEALS